jgi:hypothetical protein
MYLNDKSRPNTADRPYLHTPVKLKPATTHVELDRLVKFALGLAGKVFWPSLHINISLKQLSGGTYFGGPSFSRFSAASLMIFSRSAFVGRFIHT